MLWVLIVPAFAGKTDTMRIQSRLMDTVFFCTVITPDSYRHKPKKHYPVVYLLNGAGGSYRSWISKVPALISYADRYEMILACPDGGISSWYFDSPADTSKKYETFFATELILAVDKAYRTLAMPSGRAITGYSMGGHGALFLCLRHPDIWSACGGMSACVDMCPYPENWEIWKRLGPYEKNPGIWAEWSVTNMLHLAAKSRPAMIIDIGTGDFFYDQNREMHRKLLSIGVEHDYIERPGVHDWKYWINAVEFQLLFFHKYFEMSLAVR